MRKLLAGVGLTGLVLASVLGLVLFHAWLFVRLPGGPDRTMIVVEIPPRAGAMAIAHLLEEKRLISDAQKFYLLCRYRKASNRLRAGEYGFLVPTTPDVILDRLIQGKVLLHRITFPEGSTITDIANAIEQQGLGSAQAIERAARDPDLVRALDVTGPNLEGYLFPETYHFPKSQEPQSILRAMVHQFRQQFPEAWVKRSEEIGMSISEVVTLASIVEKEAAVDSERPLIASVFHNRLKKNMPLQSDPTSVYDLPGHSGPVTSVHLKRQSPYNTYVVKGLPIGPICNPGRKSIEAVLYPETTPYLYFVSNLDGTHRFSVSIAEHQQAVGQYRDKVRVHQEQTKSSPQNRGGAEGPSAGTTEDGRRP